MGLVDGLVDGEAGDLAGSVLLELDVAELDALDGLVRRHLGVESLYLIFEIGLRIGYTLVLEEVRIWEDLCNDRDLILLDTAFASIYNDFIHTLNLLKISLDLFRIDILSV